MERVKKQKKLSGTPLMVKRWVTGSLIWIVMLLIVVDFAVVYYVHWSFYSSAKQTLEYRMNSLMSEVPASSLTLKERRSALLQLVEEYPEKERFEVMLIDVDGGVIVTSSGFQSEAVRPEDYVLAAESDIGRGMYVGRSDQGEKVAAVTQLLDSQAGDILAVRMVTSLSGVDGRVSLIAVLVTAGVIVIMLLSVLSSTYFISSISKPVQEIGRTAKLIASGDFNVRIDTKYNDEMGELCDQINEMARGLEDTERMKNEFISSVSHELRTPLTSIKGWGETLRTIGPGDRETFGKGMSIILSETNRLSGMVEDLLDFSRMQRNAGLSFSEERLDLVAELTEAVMIVDQRARRGGIEVNYSEPAETFPINGDKGRIRQVFTNIFDNAIKYSKPGGAIDVSLASSGGFAVAEIRDHGAGIPEKDIPKLTTRFYKASNSTTGSGIGLSVVSEIMNLHGGRLEIESKLGSGTAIRLYFPLITKEKGAEDGK